LKTQPMNNVLPLIACARIPLESLSRLAGLRCHPGIRVALHGQHAWLCWPAGDELVVTDLIAIAGVRFFIDREGTWYAHGSRLPAYDLPPMEPSLPLDQVLLPPSEDRQSIALPSIEPVRVQLVPDDKPRRTRALLCSLTVLSDWADRAPAFQIEPLQGAISDARVLLLGDNLPFLQGNQRFWGERVLIPLGKRFEPVVDEDDLLEAWGAEKDEIVLFDGEQAEIIPVSSIKPLSRASIRMASRGDAQ
jgi:hypothetical protein